jgi:hypothetical protein
LNAFDTGTNFTGTSFSRLRAKFGCENDGSATATSVLFG